MSEQAVRKMEQVSVAQTFAPILAALGTLAASLMQWSRDWRGAAADLFKALVRLFRPPLFGWRRPSDEGGRPPWPCEAATGHGGLAMLSGAPSGRFFLLRHHPGLRSAAALG